MSDRPPWLVDWIDVLCAVAIVVGLLAMIFGDDPVCSLRIRVGDDTTTTTVAR